MNWKGLVTVLGLAFFLSSCSSEEGPHEALEDPIVSILDPSAPSPSPEKQMETGKE